jgi:hypothetical protein
MPLRFSALPEAPVGRLRADGPDANGQPAERRLSNGDGNPCRFCLADIPRGREMLVLAWRPFPALQPYAETGPIFLCAACARRPDGPDLPPVVASRPRFMVRGYGPDHRIAYGTGGIVETAELREACARLLAAPGVAYLHLRSAVNGCYQLRVDRAPG